MRTYDDLKRDPRDTLVRVGGFYGAYDSPHYVTFRPWNWDAPENLQGNGEPLPDYAVWIALPYSRRGR